MSRMKQIEEMRKDLIEIFDEEYEKHRIITADFAAIKMTGKGYHKQEWISVEERLPESRFVIVCDEYGTVGEAFFFKQNGRFEWIEDGELAFATHWMPLPEAPKGGE